MELEDDAMVAGNAEGELRTEGSLVLSIRVPMVLGRCSLSLRACIARGKKE